MGSLSQSIIIGNLNKEFRRLKFPSNIQFNQEGVCNGLVAVYAMYALEGQDALFVSMLELITSGKFTNHQITPQEESQIFLFACRVMIAFLPSNYDSRFNQSNAFETLSVDDKPISSSFGFSLATTDENWVKIMKEIDLKENEVMPINSANHAISIRKENNCYKVYDPNYREGFRRFATEIELINELHNINFKYKPGNIGLQIQVLRHPNDITPRQFPNVPMLYKKYLTDDTTAKLKSDISFDTLQFAADTVNDPGTMAYLLAKTAPNSEAIFSTATRAVVQNNPHSLGPLLDKMSTEPEEIQNKKILKLVNSSLTSGRLETFEVLDTHFGERFNNSAHLLVFIRNAARGGNLKLLEKVIAKAEDQQLRDTERLIKNTYPEMQDISHLVESLINNEHYCRNATFAYQAAITSAINSGSVECLSILMQRLEKHAYKLNTEERIGHSNLNSYPLHKKQKVDYLMEAIRQNQRSIAMYLIEEKPQLSPKLLQTILMSSRAVQRTDLGLLEYLQEKGMVFSSAAQQIIAEKKENTHLSILTKLTLLIDYIAEKLGQGTAKGVTIDEKKLGESAEEEAIRPPI